jgi:hypothetical protein
MQLGKKKSQNTSFPSQPNKIDLPTVKLHKKLKTLLFILYYIIRLHSHITR